MSLRRPLLCLSLVVSVTALSHAQDTPTSIVLDFTALAADGTPVADLRPSEITLQVDGRPQSVSDLRLVEQVDRDSPIPPPYATNQLTQGRTVALAVDVTRLAATMAPAVGESVDALVNTLAPSDRLGLVMLAGDGFSTDFTTRHELIQAAAESVQPQAATDTSRDAREAAAIAALTLLDRLCTSLASEPGYKTVILLSAPFTPTSDTRQVIQSVADTVARQRIHLVVMDPAATEPDRAGGLAALAAATGGTLVPSAGNQSASVTSIVERGAIRYEVSFVPTAGQQNDKVHRLTVGTTRAGTRVSGPPTVFIGKASETPDPMVPLTDMLTQTRPFRDLPLRATVFPLLHTDGASLRLLVLAETIDPFRSLAWAEFALIAPSGAIVSQWKAPSAEAALRPIMTAVIAPEGSYRFRMAASEISGRRGAVDVEFDATLGTVGPFTASPLMFGALADGSFMPVLQPAAGADAIMGYVELYGTAAETDTLGARFELSRTADAEPLLVANGGIRTSATPDRRAALTTLELATIPPGDYLVSAIITVNGTDVGRVTNTLRRAVR